MKLSCKCGMTIPGTQLNQSIACVGKRKSIWQLLAVSGVGWGLYLAASGNNVRSGVPTYGMVDTGARSAE